MNKKNGPLYFLLPLMICLFCNSAFGQTPTAQITSNPGASNDTIFVCSRDSIDFGDVSSGGPIGRNWTFEGGSPTSSNSGNVRVAYNASGLYKTILEVWNGAGSDFDTVFVRVRPPAQAEITASPSTILCPGSSVQLQVNILQGTPNYSYQWSPSTGLSSTTSPNPMVSGIGSAQTYTVKITDGNGCDTSISTTITVNPNLAVFAGNDTTLCSDDSTQMKATASGGDGGPYTYLWTPSTGLSNDTILRPMVAPEATTTYTLTVTDGAGCSRSDQVTITASPALLANAGLDTLLCGDDEINLGGSPSADGGFPGYSYLWSPSTGLNNVTFPNPALQGISSDTEYILRVTDNKGCVVRDTVFVRYGNSVNVDAGSGEKICSGDTVQLQGWTDATGGRYVIEWKPATGLSDSSILNPIAVPTTTTIYSLTVTDTIVGCVSSDQVTLTVNPPIFVDAGDDTVLCDIPETSFKIGGDPTASGGTPGYIYHWTPSTFLDAFNAPNPNVSGLNQDMEYVVRVTDSEGCIAYDTINITINPPLSSEAGDDFHLCYGDTAFFDGQGVGGSPPYRYRWFPNGIMSDDQDSAPYALITDTTTFYLMVTDSVLCSDVDTITVFVMPELIADAGRDTGICFGDSIQLGGVPAAAGGSGSYQFQWSPTTYLDDPNTNRPWAVGLASTVNYALIITDDSGCVAIDSVEVIPSEEIIADAGPDTLKCFDGPVGLGGSPTGSGGTPPLTYAWTNNTGATLSPSNTTANPFVTQMSADTWFVVTVTDRFNCSQEDSVFVRYNPEVFVNAGRDTTLCYGSDIQLNGMGSGGTGPLSYSWMPASNLDDPNTPNPTASNLTGDVTYFLSVTDAENCTVTDAVVIRVADELVADAGADGVICFNGDFQMGGSPTASGGMGGNYSYNWSPAIGLNSTTAPNPTLSNISEDTCYVLTITDSLGCVDTDTICITVNPEIIADSGTVSEVCPNTPTPLNASATGGTAPYTFRWTPGTGLSNRNIPNPSVNIGSDQSYVIVVTDAVGCTDTTTLDLTVLPEVIAEAGPEDTLCFGDTVYLNGSASGGTPGFTYLWTPSTGLSDPGIPNPFVTGITSTTLYTLTVTDSKGCTGTDFTRVRAADELVADAGPDQVLCFGEFIELGGSPVASGGAGSYRYNWNPGTGLDDSSKPRPRVFNLSADQTYVLTLTDRYGCVDYDTVFVRYNPEIIPNIFADSTICFGDSVLLNLEINGGTAPYQVQWTPATGLDNPNIQQPMAGPSTSTNYTASITDSLGCQVSISTQINVNPELIAEAGARQTLCFGDSVQLGGSPSAVGGNGSYQYSWSPGALLSDSTIGNPWASNLSQDTTFVLTLTDGLGCTVFDSVRIFFNEDLIVDAGLDVNVCANVDYQMPASVSGGTGPYTYNWSPSTGLNDPSLLQPTANLSSDQLYTLVVTDAFGCKDSAQVLISVYDAMTLNLGGGSTICAGSTLQIGGAPTAQNGTAPYSFNWSPGVLLDDSTSSNPVISGLSSGQWFYLEVIDFNGCIAEDSIFIDFSENPIANFESISSCGQDSACRNISTTLTDLSQNPNPGNPINQWEWDINNDGSIEYMVQNPSHVFTALGNTPVKLKVTTADGCTDSIVGSVYVTETPVANFIMDQDSGCSSLDVVFSNFSSGNITTYNWLVFADSNGVRKPIYTSNNLDPNPVPTFNQSINGDTTYYIELTVSNCCGSTSFLDSVLVKPSPFPEFEWSYTDASCSPAEVAFQPDEFITGAPDSIVFDWGDGTGTQTVYPNANPPIWNIVYHTYIYNGNSNDTTYQVTMTAYNDCGVASITKDILVKSKNLNAFMKVNGPSNGCSPLTTSFINASSRSTNASWCFDYDTTNQTCAAPLVSSNDTVSYTFVNPGVYTVALFINNNCSYDTVYRYIEVFESPSAAFSTSPNRCEGEQVDFINNSTIGGAAAISSYQWDFGDTASGAANQSTAISPSHTFSGPGTYTVCLAVMSNSNPGCPDTLCQTVTIYKKPVASFTTMDLCFNEQPVPLVNNSTEPPGYTDITYIWNMGDPGNNSFIGATPPNFSYLSPGTYTINLSIEAEFEGGQYVCADDTSIQITIDPSPVAGFNYVYNPMDSCGAPVTIDITNTTNPISPINYQWFINYANDPGQTPRTERDPSYTFNSEGLYEIMLTVENQYGCVDTLIDSIGVYPVPVAGFTVPNQSCTGDSVPFTDESTYPSLGLGDSIAQWFWEFGDGQSSTLQNPYHIYNASGTYDITLTVTTTEGCIHSITQTDAIRIDDAPTAYYTYVQTGGIYEWQFNQLASNGAPPYTYFWDFGDSTTSTEPDPLHQFRLNLYFQDLWVPVCFTVTDQNQCSNTYCEEFLVEGFSLHVPNALAPERATSGEERIFLPKGRNLIQYHLKIYDTWGNLIWETTALDNKGQPAEGWDGTVNGKLMPQGSYVWQIDAVFIDGTGWRGKVYEDGQEINIGTVNLIR